MESSESFKKVVSRHKFSPSTSLKEINTLWHKFAHKYDLRACAIFLLSMRNGSVVITMLVPESLEMMLKSTDPEFFKEHSIVHLQLNDILFYEQVHMCIRTMNHVLCSNMDVTYIPPSSLLPISQRRVPTNFNSNSLKKPLCLLLTCLIMMNLSRWTCLVLPFSLLIFTLCRGIRRCFSMGGLIVWVAQPA